jgi:hypothetical protein
VGPGGAQVGGDLGVEGSVQTTGGYLLNVTTVTANTTLTVDQAGVVLVNNTSAVVITLPDAAAATGLVFTVKRIGTADVGLYPASGTIDGTGGYTILIQYVYLTVISDGTNWTIISWG